MVPVSGTGELEKGEIIRLFLNGAKEADLAIGNDWVAAYRQEVLDLWNSVEGNIHRYAANVDAEEFNQLKQINNAKMVEIVNYSLLPAI